MKALKVVVLEPTFPEPETAEVTKEDVWGKWTESHWRNGGRNGPPIAGPKGEPDEWVASVKVHGGMVIADHGLGGFDEKWCRSKVRCPVFKDFIGYKSVTVVCDASIREEVAYWIEYVQGGDSIQAVKELEDGKVAFRSDYMAW